MDAHSGQSSASLAPSTQRGPGPKEGLETRAAASLEVKQINQSSGHSLSSPSPPAVSGVNPAQTTAYLGRFPQTHNFPS